MWCIMVHKWMARDCIIGKSQIVNTLCMMPIACVFLATVHFVSLCTHKEVHVFVIVDIGE